LGCATAFMSGNLVRTKGSAVCPADGCVMRRFGLAQFMHDTSFFEVSEGNRTADQASATRHSSAFASLLSRPIPPVVADSPGSAQKDIAASWGGIIFQQDQGHGPAPLTIRAARSYASDGILHLIARNGSIATALWSTAHSSAATTRVARPISSARRTSNLSRRVKKRSSDL